MDRSPRVDAVLDALMPNRREAIASGTCVFCGNHVEQDKVAPIDWREFLISGSCPTCFAELDDDGA